MLVALLALVSAGIFAAHILDAFRAGPHAVDFRQLTFGLGPDYAEIRRVTNDAIQTPALWQSLFDLNSGIRLLHVNGRFAPQAADQKRPLGREQRSSFDAMVFGSL